MTNYLILVNKENPVGEKFVPSDLVLVNKTELLDKEVYERFKVMRDDALKEGYNLDIDSGYRSYDHQKDLYTRWVLEYGEEYTRKYCAPAGTSEHQTGLCLDVMLIRDGKVIETSEPSDPEIRWLEDNSYKYGFILRYPEGYESITGYNYENWHFRYIGVEHAKKMHSEGIKTFEEYHKKYLASKDYEYRI